MLKQQRFHVKKGARVVGVAREHYLRDDIWCGWAACTLCSQQHPVLRTPVVLLPDTNVLLHQMDFLEHKSIKGAIILSTVLEEVKHRSLPAYNRIRALIAEPSKQFFVFSNEHNKQTFIEQNSGESINDRNDRAIRVAAAWYQEHVKHSTEQGLTGTTEAEDDDDEVDDDEMGPRPARALRIVFLTNDRANLEKALADKLNAFTVHVYVGKHRPELSDVLAASTDALEGDDDPSEAATSVSDKSRDGFVNFPEHVPLSAIQRGIKSGHYLQGVYHASRDNFQDGYVSAHALDYPVLVKGTDRNRAIEGDVVAIEVFKQDAWAVASDVIEGEGTQTLGEGQFGDDNEVQQDTVSATKKQTTGRVVGIVKRNWRPYCGVIIPSPSKSSKVMFSAEDRRIPYVRIQTKQADALQGMRIIVAIDSWPVDSRNPLGHFVRSIGPIGDRETETEVVLVEHQVPFEPFSQAVLDDLPKLPWLITPQDVQCRRDIRHYTVCSVDPPGCTDIDDALHVRELPNGNYEVGVHIADVSHFIRPGTALDLEAAKRGTTVYLANKRIDMVPALLSSNLCSLIGNEDRFAFSVFWEMNAKAEILSVDYAKTIIRSKAALMYSEAQLRIDDKTDQSDITRGLRVLNSLAKILHTQRLEAGALMLASSEVRFSMEGDTKDPIDVELKQMYETNSMVEEFMLLANVTVAEFIFDKFPQCAMLRRHPVPAPARFDPLIQAAEAAGVRLGISSSKELSESLENARSPDGHAYFNTLLKMLATRCMMQAVYFCSGTLVKDEFFHYGLAAPIYTHFTSPIRRYPDIIVHRLLAAGIGADQTYSTLLDKEHVSMQCDVLNHRHRMAQYAQRASNDLYCLIFFRGKEIVTEGFVMRIRKNAVAVLCPRFGMEGPVYFDGRDDQAKSSTAGVKRKAQESSLPFTLDYDPAVPLLRVTSSTNRTTTFRVFSRVAVVVSVDESNMQRHRVVLRLLEPFIEGLSVSKPTKAAASQTVQVPSGAMDTTTPILEDTTAPSASVEDSTAPSTAESAEALPSKSSKRKAKKAAAKAAANEISEDAGPIAEGTLAEGSPVPEAAESEPTTEATTQQATQPKSGKKAKAGRL
eukprot:m.485558 g.485558  ORF g.485558 m.485558 type:complete len:1099 (+) comp57208_c0_seq10:182-3478(+)